MCVGVVEQLFQSLTQFLVLEFVEFVEFVHKRGLGALLDRFGFVGILHH